jgi:hypothetical protein
MTSDTTDSLNATLPGAVPTLLIESGSGSRDSHKSGGDTLRLSHSIPPSQPQSFDRLSLPFGLNPNLTTISQKIWDNVHHERTTRLDRARKKKRSFVLSHIIQCFLPALIVCLWSLLRGLVSTCTFTKEALVHSLNLRLGIGGNMSPTAISPTVSKSYDQNLLEKLKNCDHNCSFSFIIPELFVHCFWTHGIIGLVLGFYYASFLCFFIQRRKKVISSFLLPRLL